MYTLNDLIQEAHEQDFPIMVPKYLHDDVYSHYDPQVAHGRGGVMMYDPDTEDFTIYL